MTVSPIPVYAMIFRQWNLVPPWKPMVVQAQTDARIGQYLTILLRKLYEVTLRMGHRRIMFLF